MINVEKLLRKLSESPLRMCHSLHKCCVCESAIMLGDLYYDGGYAKRAHLNCVARNMKIMLGKDRCKPL